MLDGHIPIQEKAPIKVELATAKDWEDCKRLRIEEISGEDAEMFGTITEDVLNREKSKSKEDWQKEIKGEEQFFVLSKVNGKSVGFGRAIHVEEGVWRMGWGYTQKEFRNKGLGTKNSILRLKELLKRGAKKASVYILSDNKASIHVQESLGFKLALTRQGDLGPIDVMEIDLTEKAIIKKINDFMI